MAKQRRRVVPVRRVRLNRGEDGWSLDTMRDLPPRPVPASADSLRAPGLWAEAVDRHDDLLHRIVLDPPANDQIEVLLPVDSRCVTLNLHEGKPGSKPVATFDMALGGYGGPPRR